MKTVIQRVKSANVKVGGETIGAINKGLLILIGVEPDDTEAEVNWIGCDWLDARLDPGRLHWLA